MDDFIPFGSRTYCLLVLLLAFSRGMDFLSTWVATPNLVLEGNPIAKKLGWGWGGLLNIGICLGMALWPATAIESYATMNFGMGGPEVWRKADILADAVIALLSREPSARPGRAWVDEELLRAEGVTDFAKYQCVPGQEPPHFPFSALPRLTEARR